MTEHPGEQFPPDVDPDVEPYPSEETPDHPDYDTEPGQEGPSYDEAKSNDQQANDEQAGSVAYDDETGEPYDVSAEPARIDPAEVEFGPEFARPRGEEHEHAFVAESAEDPQAEAEDPRAEEEGHPLVEETMDRLDGLRDRPVSEHAEVYADLHERLQSALVEADVEHGDRI